MDPEMVDAPGLFDEVVFHIITSEKLPKETADRIKSILLSNGALEAAPREISATSRVTIDLEEATHIIAGTTDFPGYSDAESLMIPVVTSEWVRRSMQKKRLAHVRPFNPDPRFFFSDVIATVAELPVGDKEAICGGIIAMGGQYSNHLTKFTTHIVALNIDNDKCKQAACKKLRVKMVLPHWFDDCLKLGRRIDETPYLLPNAEIERVDSTAPIAMPLGLDLTYTHAHNSGPMAEDPPNPRAGCDIFKGKRVLLGKDMRISERLRGVLVGVIGQTKGSTVVNIADADIYIGQYRDGDDYVTACRRSLYVGNLTWLYWMFAHGEWTNTTNRLLHYPIVRGGMPEMRDKVITVSNYGGDARLFLENLIEACGAKFTKSMKADNTHLITARAHSEKCTAAKEWNVHMVNHLWIEDTYAKWKVMSMTDAKYTHFPRRTNLMEVVGQTRIDLPTLVQFYEPDSGIEVSPERASAPHTVASTAINGRIKPPAARSATTSTPVPKRRRAHQEDDSPAPPSTGRKAKERATARLHDTIMPDLVLYQKELKRKGGVMGGRSRAGSVESSENPRPSSKRSKSVESGDEKAAKKGKKRPPKPTIFLLITAYTGWLGQLLKEDTEKRILADLGIKCVDDPGQCTYLAAPHLVRTEKFCCALAQAPVVVSTKWVETCIREERLVEAASFLLKDPEGERRLNVKLEASLERAKENNGKLLEGQAIYCAPGVHGGYDVCRRIVEANGGVCILFRSLKHPANAPDSERLVLLSGDTPGDKKLWSKFKGMAESTHKKWSIYRSDWILEMAMNQQIIWGQKYEVKVLEG